MFMLTIDSGDPEFDKVQKNPHVEVLLAILCVTIKAVHPTEKSNELYSMLITRTRYTTSID